MPIDGIGNGCSYSGYTTSGSNKSHSASSSFSKHIEGARQSEYGFNRGHRRSNAVDLRIVTSVQSTTNGAAPVSKNSTSLVDKLGSGVTIKP
ncbi:hypothetical protein AK34_5192 [Burkholderia dolosa AU0158]|nr:hypothetical protein AK34_5192 [Burkholderia dolosa AU0158]VWB78573.1 hypothetical protein BDO18943_03707 [Burkholderia dolosa]